MDEDQRGWCFAKGDRTDPWRPAASRADAIGRATECFEARVRLDAALGHVTETITKMPLADGSTIGIPIVEGKRRVVFIGRAMPVTHETIVSGLGDTVREQLNVWADDLVGEAAEDYPDMPNRPFDEALEAFVLAWLEQHAAKPTFFQVEDEEEVDVPCP